MASKEQKTTSKNAVGRERMKRVLQPSYGASQATMTPPMSGRQAVHTYLAALLLVCLAVATAASLWAVPTGPIEEHFALGQQLRATGSLGGSVFRPPGYPAFVALVLWARDAAGLKDRMEDSSAVIAAQWLALLLLAVLLFRLLAPSDPAGGFLVGALMFANPLSVVLAGALGYPMLDVVLILLGTLALAATAREANPRPLPTLVAGLVFGLAALVRPVALAIPGSVAALEWLRGRWTDGGRLLAWLSLGMLVVVGPYLLRNHAVTGRFVPVSAQAGFNLWASSIGERGPDDPYVSWRAVWEAEGLRIYSEVTGEKEYSLPVFAANALRLNDAFGRAALRNIRRDPWTYAANVANNLWRFPLDTTAWWWRRFAWENAGRPMQGTTAVDPTPRARQAARVAGASLFAQSLVGLIGLLVGLRCRDPWARPVLAVLAALWIGNSVTLLLSRYTYVKLPLLVLSTGMLFRAPPNALTTFLRHWVVPAVLVLALAATFTMLRAGG
jgi:hypothetical protein